jgi:hypothetical protein
MYIAGPFPKKKRVYKYILVAIDHYSKWNEAKAVPNHGAKPATKFFKDEIICKYGIPKFIIIDNEREWSIELDVMCRYYNITHQFTTP